MKLEFKRTEVQLNIYGQDIKISMPSEEQVLKMQEEMTGAKEQEDSHKILLARRNFLISLGIPEELLKSMEFKHVSQLAEGLIGEIGKKD